MDSFLDIFSSVLDYCRNKMSQTAYELWILALEPVRLESDGSVLLSIKSPLKYNVVLTKYIPLLTEAFEKVLGFETTVRVELAEDAAERPDLAGFDPIRDGDVAYEYTFSTFIVGSTNKFAHAASLAVAANPAGNYNPLFIYGNSGLGKTHLMYAISNEIKNNNPGMNICYIKGEDFTNELIDAIRNDTRREFREKYRQADVLLVDDIQFIGGKEGTQEEFFHTFNNLFENKKQIVLTSDRPPKEIKTLEDRLRTRFEWGLIADIQPPDFETRIAIIRRKAELLGFEIPEDIAEYIANKLKNNIRQLEGAVKKLNAYHNISGAKPSIMLAQEAIRDILNDTQPTPITIDRILSEVSRIYGVTAEDIKSSKRSQNISSARQVAVYVIREITQMSMSAIGDEIGGRNHSTIVYTIQQVEQNISIDPKYKELIEDIIKNIRNN